ncbi:MAG: SemiSWEET transporter [Deltaproteobacteria bacterium]|nr:SemiSWEET transporter [Deltaproteobacteria bacterium]
MNSTTLLGLVAGALTTVSFLPQVLKTWRTRSTGDFSFGMLTLLSAGILVWIGYGFLIDSLPVILANIVTFALLSVILAFKIIYK